ncbi:MAG TPA: patatin-like phospholipase family protein, partial [Candidatus Baltobacteraceae bacterium]|nr:patatin-like phospholipase family protein [Candidatus Baltobacteraceae bacterium]
EGGSGKLLVEQLRASAAIPLAFDPVVLEDSKGRLSQFVDGGVVANTPIAVAHALSSAVDTVILGPPFKGATYRDASEVTEASFETMQRVMMYDALRAAYIETLLLNTLSATTPAFRADMARARGLSPEQLDAFIALLSDTSYHVLRPQNELPVSIFGFSDAKELADTYQTGVSDGSSGFTPFNAAIVI